MVERQKRHRTVERRRIEHDAKSFFKADFNCVPNGVRFILQKQNITLFEIGNGILHELTREAGIGARVIKNGILAFRRNLDDRMT